MGMSQDTFPISYVNDHLFPLAHVWTAFLSHLGLLDSGDGVSAWKKQSRIIKVKTGWGTSLIIYWLLGLRRKNENLSGAFQLDLLCISVTCLLADIYWIPTMCQTLYENWAAGKWEAGGRVDHKKSNWRKNLCLILLIFTLLGVEFLDWFQHVQSTKDFYGCCRIFWKWKVQSLSCYFWHSKRKSKVTRGSLWPCMLIQLPLCPCRILGYLPDW